MGNPYWPLFDLRIRTPRVEIRLPNDDVLVELTRLALKGVHDPNVMPFLHPWTDEPSPQLERGMLQWGWRHRAEWSSNNWSFNGAYQGKGIGKEMRSAILHFAFETLEALEARSGGFIDNASSLGVSRAFGYEDDGRRSVLRRGIPTEMLELRLDCSKWREIAHSSTEVSGFEGCRDFFIGPK